MRIIGKAEDVLVSRIACNQEREGQRERERERLHSNASCDREKRSSLERRETTYVREKEKWS